MPQSLIFMYSGQGSQYYRMGMDLYHANPAFRARMEAIDGLTRDLTGRSPLAVVNDPQHDIADPFDNLLDSSLAIFMVECALTQTLDAYDIRPDQILGSSLGMLPAAVAAGCASLEECISGIVRMSAALEQHAPPGVMIGVLNPIRVFDDCPRLQQISELAAINFDSGFVLSAPKDYAVEVEARLDRAGCIKQRMPVSYAFHSRWMDAAKEPFFCSFSGIPKRVPQIPLVCTASQEKVSVIDPGTLWLSMRGQMRFIEAITRFEQQGPCRYIDLSPSATLATFLRHGLKTPSGSESYSILSPFRRGAQNLDQLLAAM